MKDQKPVPYFCLQCENFRPPQGCKEHGLVLFNAVQPCINWEHLHFTKNGITTIGKHVAVWAAVIGAMVSLRMLPWATSTSLEKHEQDNQAMFTKVETQVNDLHKLFFPRK